MSKNYQDLIVWQRAMDLAEHVYHVTKNFPPQEQFGLTAQLRSSATSVPSNIAEGHGRLTRGELRQFLGIARGSLLELQTQLILSKRLNYLSNDTILESNDVGRLLNGLLRFTNN
ncbi:MAG TPA: four helix bundle protein [Thermoanaerobaculia bacterium]